METEVKKTGKEFEENCQKCPGMLAFNRQVTKKEDKVIVTCQWETCFKEKKEK